MKLRISDDLALPPDFITQTAAILAVRGAGKSNLAAVLAEEMFRAKLPFVVIDPTGTWIGLRSAGTGPGLGVVIFGGREKDVPLERGSGAAIADLVAAERLSSVLDVSELSEGDKVRFLTDFARRLYRANLDPLHLFLEEADDYVPQKPFRDQAECLRAFQDIVRRGRARGLGITMITQRSAVISKDVLTQIETLFALRTTSPQDRKAIEAWVDYHGQSRELVDSLPSLKPGEAWVWSPHYLGTTKRIQVRRRTTLDTAATPKDAAGRRPPATKADVDLDAVTRAMAETIERAKAEDPKELRRELAAAKARITALERAKPAAAPPKRVEVPILKDAQIARLEAALARAEKIVGKIAAPFDQLGRIGDTARAAALEIATAIRVARQPTAAPATARPASTTPARPAAAAQPRHAPALAPRPNGHDESAELGVGERRTLTAIAQYEGRATRELVTVMTGYKRSTRDLYIQRLGRSAYVEVRGAQISATAAGLAALGTYERLPTGDALRLYWLERLPEGERRTLEAVVAGQPDPLSRDAISDATGYQRSTRDLYLQRLARRQLVESVGRGEVRASSELFD